MRKFGSTRLRQLLEVKLTATFSKSRTIDVLPYRRLSDRECSAEDVYEVSSCPWFSDEAVGEGAVQGCTPKDPGVKVL